MISTSFSSTSTFAACLGCSALEYVEFFSLLRRVEADEYCRAPQEPCSLESHGLRRLGNVQLVVVVALEYNFHLRPFTALRGCPSWVWIVGPVEGGWDLVQSRAAGFEGGDDIV
jgi:hypothetical protein